MHPGAFCSSKANPQKCPHLALPGSDFCAKHQPPPEKTIPEMFVLLGSQLAEVSYRLDKINADLILLTSKMSIQRSPTYAPVHVPVVVPLDPEMKASQPTGSLFFLNEKHELPRITKSQLRKEQRAAREKRKAQEQAKGSNAVSRRSKSVRSGTV